jgi:hypothetical protein
MPLTRCVKCHGFGTVIVCETKSPALERWEATQDILIFLGIVALAAACGVTIAMWRLNHWKWF